MKKLTNVLPDITLVNGMVQLTQGENYVCLTKSDINALKMLMNGDMEGDYYITKVCKVELQRIKENNSVLAICDDNTVYLPAKAVKLIFKFREQNNRRILWDMDFKRYRRY